jgi:hypothetical protein
MLAVAAAEIVGGRVSRAGVPRRVGDLRARNGL